MKYRQEVQEPHGWSRWIYPKHGIGKHNYRMSCCDCGLVHEFQFRIVKEPSGRLSVKFRASRNDRATAGIRRGKKCKASLKSIRG